MEPPEKIVVDHGNELHNSTFHDMCVERNIAHHIIVVDHHQSAGRIERFNRTIREAIRKVNPVVIREEVVEEVLRKYNITKHTAIKMSPSEAWNGMNSEVLCT